MPETQRDAALSTSRLGAGTSRSASSSCLAEQLHQGRGKKRCRRKYGSGESGEHETVDPRFEKLISVAHHFLSCPLCAPLSSSSVNAQALNGESALHSAAQHGRAEVVKLLLDFHADPTKRNNNDETPLDLACQYGRIEVCFRIPLSREKRRQRRPLPSLFVCPPASHLASPLVPA